MAAGHEVTGTTRSESRADQIRAAGARAAVCDALDAPALQAAVAEAAPEVVVHQLTALPDRFEPRNSALYDATNRVRREATRTLVEAARADRRPGRLPERGLLLCPRRGTDKDRG